MTSAPPGTGAAAPPAFRPRLLPLADGGVVAEFEGDEISDAVSHMVRALRRALEERPPEGMIETVPTYRSLLVIYDPLRATAAAIRAAVAAAASQADLRTLPAGRLIEIPTAYGGPYGPDLADVAAELGLSEPDVVSLHAGQEYRVYMLGFTPGYPYMGALPARLRVSRLASPRTHVPERSVAIAGQQTGVYPVASPGGWRVIGRTPLRIYDPGRAAPFLLEAGDRARFVPISAAEYEREAQQDGPAPAPPSPARPDLMVEDGGLLTTVQDLGRLGYRRFGLPQGGGMDPVSLRIVNQLLGNPSGAAALEFAAPGPRLVALRGTVIALGGADHSPAVNGRPAPMWSAFELREGDVVAFGLPKAGQWGYLAVPGGVEVPEIMGSRSTYIRGGLGGYGGRQLQAGARVAASRRAPAARLSLPAPLRPAVGGAVSLRIVVGPQSQYFTEESLATLCREQYHISMEIDRLGYRLDGPRMAHRSKTEMLSDGLLPGAVQVPSGGQPIVIMPDGPTSGGYPKIAVVVRPDLRGLAQVRRHDAIRFREVSWDEAHDAAHEEAAYLASLRFIRS